ncbi:hypothetical protein [Pseudanabaena sp. PCC 6802]|uniref:hypothetical protein n=1 Tax=Pseudanabaena sp. PCC 6802 TaxID=118173 RepID=UPI00034D96AC|nr:hypothetical protein [Pseudanabaena sp. PCC 6802]
MANIAISDLKLAGFDLFSDSESYMRDLSDTELNAQGGITPVLAASSEPCGMAVAFGAAALYDWLFG